MKVMILNSKGYQQETTFKYNGELLEAGIIIDSKESDKKYKITRIQIEIGYISLYCKLLKNNI